jgi:hypothetical protein
MQLCKGLNTKYFKFITKIWKVIQMLFAFQVK